MFDSPVSDRSPAKLTPLEDPVRPLRLPSMWFALCIGNTRSHWAQIAGEHIQATWDAPHLTPEHLAGDILRDLPHRTNHNRHAPAPVQHSPHTRDQAQTLDQEPKPVQTSCHDQELDPRPPIVIASVVPSQTELWQRWLDRQAHPYRILQLADIPLAGLYATLGIDRALAGLGVGQRLGFPCLTIDGGTALTFTGFANEITPEDDRTIASTASYASGCIPQSQFPDQPDQHPDPPDPPPDSPTHHSSHPRTSPGSLIGGAILPGMGLQYRSLERQTAQLSELYSTRSLTSTRPQIPIERWARDTPGAINSGIHRAIGATAWDFIVDWRRRYPGAIVVLTGGDAIAMEAAIVQHVYEREGRSLSSWERSRTLVIPEAIMWGMVTTLQAIGAASRSG